MSLAGIVAGVDGLLLGSSSDIAGLLAIVALVGIGQAVALTVSDEIGGSSISLSAVGAIAGAALFGPRAALAIAITIAVVDWSAQRIWTHQVLFNIGALSLASLSAAGVFAAAGHFDFTGTPAQVAMIVAGILAGLVYFGVNMSLVSIALAMEGHERWLSVFRERFAWLWLHYLVYGFVAGVMAVAYSAAALWGLAVFVVPLLLMRKTQEAYLTHQQRSAKKLREAAETIQTQNVSLEQANRLLKERSTAAMESLSATVDARDSYTAGHSRRVQQLALAIGRELGLSQAELDLLGHAALFHDIGKLAIPDAILLKPARSTTEEWALMKRHAEEGARIIDRLGFLGDAVPAIRHHHERFDGTRLPGPVDRGGDPARRPDHPRRGRARLDAHDPHLPGRQAPRGGSLRAQADFREPVLPRAASLRSSGSCRSRASRRAASRRLAVRAAAAVASRLRSSVARWHTRRSCALVSVLYHS